MGQFIHTKTVVGSVNGKNLKLYEGILKFMARDL